MKIKTFIFGLVAICATLVGTNANAGIPVIDGAQLAQQIQQVMAWAQQYQQMEGQLQQQQQQYDSMNGLRSMGSIANNPSSRMYLPQEYQNLLSNGTGQWKQIYEAARKFDLGMSGLSSNSDAVQAYNAYAKQAAINRASAEQSYNSAGSRFSDLQILLDRINTSHDAKDIADLQARIQAEQTMLQNEGNRLNAMKQLADAQRDIQAQQNIEMNIKSGKPSMPAW